MVKRLKGQYKDLHKKQIEIGKEIEKRIFAKYGRNTYSYLMVQHLKRRNLGWPKTAYEPDYSSQAQAYNIRFGYTRMKKLENLVNNYHRLSYRKKKIKDRMK
jgi:hypothetical protein